MHTKPSTDGYDPMPRLGMQSGASIQLGQARRRTTLTGSHGLGGHLVVDSRASRFRLVSDLCLKCDCALLVIESFVVEHS